MFFIAGQSDKQKLLLEKEAKLRREDDTRGWDNAKLEAVSRKHYLETRGRKIEAVEAEVIKSFNVKWEGLLKLW